MSSETAAVSRLDQIIARLEERVRADQVKLDRARTVRTALDEPEILAVLTESFSNGTATKSLNFDKLKAFFETRENEWATFTEMTEGTGIPLSSVRQVLYKVAPERFERDKSPIDKKKKVYRLLVESE